MMKIIIVTVIGVIQNLVRTLEFQFDTGKDAV